MAKQLSVDISEQQLEKLRRELRIDRDEIDDCVIEHPQVFYHVTEASVLALAQRDATELALEEAKADEDERVRAQAADQKLKITETEIKKAITQATSVKRLNREYLEHKLLAARWGALKESFLQRSYAVREVVDINIARMYSTGSIAGGRDRGAEKARAAAIERRQRRTEED